MKYKKLYDYYYNKFTKEGIRIYHRKLRGDICGAFDSDSEIIVIQESLYGTKHGLFTLWHEVTHYRDYKAGRFKLLFNGRRGRYTKERMAEIIRGEQSAGRGAEKYAKKHNIQYVAEEFRPLLLKRLIAFWRKDYFCN